MDRRLKSLLLPAFALSCGLVVSPAPRLFAAEPDPPKGEEQTQEKKKKEKAASPPLRFTDDDLEKYKKPQPPPPPPAEDTDAAAAAGSAKPSPPAPPKGPVPAAAAAKAPGAAPAAPKTAGAATAAKPAGTPAKPAAAVSTVPPNLLPAAAKASASKSAAPKEPPDPLQQWKDREAKDAIRDRELQARRERISGMESRLSYLQEKRLAILDPLRVMPKAPTDADASADKSKGARDLLKDVEAEIEQVQKDLDAAKEELVATETRFAEESGRH
jgi:hypothetical protein